MNHSRAETFCIRIPVTGTLLRRFSQSCDKRGVTTGAAITHMIDDFVSRDRATEAELPGMRFEFAEEGAL
jgi:hypothetical protein